MAFLVPSIQFFFGLPHALFCFGIHFKAVLGNLGSETWRLTENNKRQVEATEMDAPRRSSRISGKERVRNVTVRQQIGLEETIIKEIEQNQLTWYGHVQRMAEGRLPHSVC